MDDIITNTAQSNQSPDKKPVLLQVLPALISGGVERGTVEIARAAAQAGFESLVASAGGPMVRQIEQAGAKHFELPLDSKNPLTIYGNISLLRDIIYRNKVDIVHARSRAPAWSAYYAAKSMNCHFVTTFHGFYSNGFPFKKSYNSIMTKGERVIAISNFIAEHIKSQYKIPDDKIRVVHRGVDMDYFDPEKVDEERVKKLREKWRLTEDWPVIFLPGRITRWKGQEFFIRALSRVDNMSFYCVMAGDSSGHRKYFQELMKSISLYRMEKNIRLVPAEDDMPAAYKLAHVVVSASQRPEAFGRVVVEAQAMGRPVVATAIGGSKETIIHGDTGRLVDMITTEEMAQGVKKGISISNEQRERIAVKNRQHIAENFSLDVMCRKTIEVYHELLGKTPDA